MSNVNMIIRIYVYMHILTVEPSRARGLKPLHFSSLSSRCVVEPSRARGLKQPPVLPLLDGQQVEPSRARGLKQLAVAYEHLELQSSPHGLAG